VVRAFRGRHHLHRAGLPWQNPWIESFNARFRDEVLDCELFSSILEARVIADVWRDTYNRYHPHSSLGMLAPAVFGRVLAGRPHGGGGHELVDALPATVAVDR
jgi:transposase InsO family protein